MQHRRCIQADPRGKDQIELDSGTPRIELEQAMNTWDTKN